MKTYTLMAAALLAFAATPLIAQENQPANTTSKKIAVGLDSNRDGIINAESIKTGIDAFIARELTASETQPKLIFKDWEGKLYTPISSLEELRFLDKNKDGTLSQEELQSSPTNFVTARILEGTNRAVIEHSISNNFTNINLPNKNNPNPSAKIGDDNSIPISTVEVK